jgi:hypothetical protein
MWRRLVGEWLAGSGRNRPNICVSTVILSLSSLHIPSVIHIRHNGSSIITYRQIVCCQGMCYKSRLMVIQAMTNSSAVACLFCWPSLNSSPPSSRDSSRCLYQSLSFRPGQSHPAIPQAIETTRISSPYPARPPSHPRRKDPLFTSRVSRRIPPHKHKQWQRHSWKCQPQAQARQSRHARCLCSDGSAAIHDLQPAQHCCPRQYPLRPHDCWRKRCRC